jgi:hypothetical protein
MEQRDDEKGLLEFSIGMNDSKDGSGDSEDGSGVSGDLDLLFPHRDPFGPLSSQIWPAAIASSILLRSPEFRKFSEGKDVLELGSGTGLAGLVAAEESTSCLLTDNDEEAVEFLKTTITLNQDSLRAKLTAKQIDWRDEHGAVAPVDIVMGADIAYYYFLLRPLMDTTRAFMKESGSLIMFIAQANRESQWDLYKNMRDGCYNQLTDEREPPWPGETKMLLFNLKMSDWVENKENYDSQTDGVVPMSVILHHPNGLSDISLFPFAHVATDADDENIMKSF